jgi:hypothetical protein
LHGGAVRPLTTTFTSVRVASLLVLAATCLALASVWHSARPTWHALDSGYDTYAGYPGTERADAPMNNAGFLGDMFDIFDSYLVPGDRIYYQIPDTTYGTYNLHLTVAALGDYFFLPAVQVTHLNQATVVISYDANPAKLHRHFLAQIPVPPGTFSRISVP